METIGRYKIVQLLGYGGMGQVFLARDPTLERDVALKLLRRDATQSTLRDEAKALAALNHPGIVTIYEIGEHDGQDFITMEYLPGRSLRQLLQDTAGRTDRRALLAICAKVASAVGAAHRAGILHRDIKPENIVVGASGDVKVVDFGIARRLEHAQAQRTRAVTASEVVEILRKTMPAEQGTDTIVSAGTQTVFGTPAYMAPEVLLGERSTEASDIYSLGIVIYECLSGRRPYEGALLHEVMAQMIDGPPTALVDRLGEFINRILVPDPEARPPLDEIAARLLRPDSAIAAVVRPSRQWPVIALAALVTIGLAIGAWQVASSRGTPRPAPAPVAIPRTAIAVAPIALEIPSYGDEPPNGDVVANALAKLLEQVDGLQVRGVALAGNVDPHAAVGTLDVNYLLTGSVKVRGSQLHGTFELVDAKTSARVSSVDVEQPSPQVAQLLDAVAREVARAIAPAAKLAPPSRLRADVFYQLGHPLLEAGRFTEARPYFEQMVDADPTSFDGWSELALALGWNGAQEPLVLAATERALALAPAGPKKELMRGVSLYLHADFAGARAALEPLDPAAKTRADRREVLYYLGEANWHDGRHAAAFGYFKRTLDEDQHFRPATVHPWQYAVARRDAEAAGFYIGLANESREWSELAQRHYAAVADRGVYPYDLWAHVILGDVLPANLEKMMQSDELDAVGFRVARAIEAGTPDVATNELAAAWKRILADRDANRLSGRTFYNLESIGEVVISAGLQDETRRLVTFLAEQSSREPARGYHRLSNLAAPLLGDDKLLVRTGVSERNARLADAGAAELAHDHGKAAAILAELVADPTFTWDYPERAALIRNLRALKRSKDVAALCADTVHPAIYRTALPVLRRLCKTSRE